MSPVMSRAAASGVLKYEPLVPGRYTYGVPSYARNVGSLESAATVDPSRAFSAEPPVPRFGTVCEASANCASIQNVAPARSASAAVARGADRGHPCQQGGTRPRGHEPKQ